MMPPLPKRDRPFRASARVCFLFAAGQASLAQVASFGCASLRALRVESCPRYQLKKELVFGRASSFFVSVPVVSGFARITRLGRNTPQTRARAKPETLVGAPRGEGPVNVGSFAGVQVAWAILGWVGGYWVGVYWWWVCLVGGVIRFFWGGCGFLVRGRRGC